MPSPGLQRSSSLHITIPTGVAGNLKINTSLSSVTTTSTSTTNPLKRKHSEISTTTSSSPPAETSDMLLPTPSTEAIVGPPSPVPTEIIDVEPEDFVSTSKRHGVRVRDFVLESATSSRPRIPEVWVRPIQTLAQHDMYIRRPSDGPYYSLTGKSLWRLLQLGWVTREEAKRHWAESDWKNLEEYENRPQGPYPFVISPRHAKPTAALRSAIRIHQYGLPGPDDIPDEDIYVPADEPDMWDGDIEETELDLARQEKKRKVGGSSPMSTPSEPSQPPSSEPPADTPILSHPALPSVEASPQLRRTPSITLTVPSNAPRTPSISRSSSLADLASATPVAATEESQSRQTRRGLSRTQTMVLVR